MRHGLSSRLVAILTVAALSCLGYTAMIGAWGAADPEYDLTIDNIPVNFDDDKTLYLDTQTNYRAFVIYNDHLQIRSQYLTFWDFNETYDHEDVCYVNGSYAYAPVPAMNLTLDSITEINRFQLSSENGTVTVGCTEYSTSRMTLLINSTDENATLTVRCVGLTYGHEYRVVIDGQTQGWLRVNWQRYFEYDYTGDWSNHTLTFIDIHSVTMVPNYYLQLTQTFLILGLFVGVAKHMLLPLKNNKNLKPEEITITLIKAAIYILAGTAFIMLTFKLFIGV